jgi:anti-anti-sigma regulatory factor
MLRQRLSAQDGGLALARVTEQVRHVFGLSGLDEVLTMAADVEAAFGLLMRTQPDEKPR